MNQVTKLREALRQERRMFEDWLSQDGYPVEGYALAPDDDGDYRDSDYQSMWCAWQAARALIADASDQAPGDAVIRKSRNTAAPDRAPSTDSATERDAARLMFAMQDIDGFGSVVQDKYDFAMLVMEERGHEEPTQDDELEGIRRLIDKAMAIAAMKGEA